MQKWVKNGKIKLVKTMIQSSAQLRKKSNPYHNLKSYMNFFMNKLYYTIHWNEFLSTIKKKFSILFFSISSLSKTNFFKGNSPFSSWIICFLPSIVDTMKFIDRSCTPITFPFPYSSSKSPILPRRRIQKYLKSQEKICCGRINLILQYREKQFLAQVKITRVFSLQWSLFDSAVFCSCYIFT